MLNLKKLLSLTVVICMLLPVLFGCQTKQEDFSGGKDSLFNEEFSPKFTLGDALAGEKYKKQNEFMKAFIEATTPRKIDYEFKVNNLQINEGLSLNNTNKLSGSIVFDETHSEGEFNAKILGNTVAGNMFFSEKDIVVELPDMLDKFIKLPLDTAEIEDPALPITEMPTQQELVDFGIAIDELYKKIFEFIKNGIPDASVVNRKEQVEYGDGLVDANIVSVTLVEEDLEKMILDILRYVKDDTRIENVLTKLGAFDDPATTFTKEIEELIKQIEEPESAEESTEVSTEESTPELNKIVIEATFVKSKIVGVTAVIEDSEGTSDFSFKYKEESDVKRFIYKLKTPDGTINTTYAENTATNEYKLTVTDTINSYDFVMTLKMEDENNFSLNLVSYEGDNVDVTVNVSVTEITERSMTLKIGLIVNDTADVELTIKAEILGSYKFEEPTLTADNTYDFSDPDQAQIANYKLGKNMEWLYEILGMAEPQLPEHEIQFDEVKKINTEGEMFAAGFKNIFDGDGTFIAQDRAGSSVSYYIKNGKVLYTLYDEEQQESKLHYYDGTQWSSLDEETQKLVPQETVYLYFAEVLLLTDEAEFVVSGYATVDSVETTYEVYYYPSFDTEMCYLYDSEGNVMYIYNGTYVYDVTLLGTSSGDIERIVEQYS